MSVPASLISEAEFLSLPETTQKVELLDGEVVILPSPGPRHQLILQRLVRALMNWADAQPLSVVVGQAPWDVRFGPDRILQPEAFVLLQALPAGDGPLRSVPDLCIEVLSGNRVHDRVTKRFVYAAARVREYWVVDPAGHVERWSGDGLSRHENVERTLETALLPGFALEIVSIFAGIPE